MLRQTTRAAVAAMVLGALVAAAAPAWAAEPVSVITEIRPGQGEVRIKLANEPDWRPPQPLLSLRPGDQVRATGDARIVLVFSGGRGTQVVSASNSPFTVKAPGGGERATGLLGTVTGSLFGKQDKPAYVSAFVPLSTRSLRVPTPTLLSPRETRLLPGQVRFEWAGSDLARYRIRLFGPEGRVWEQADLPRLAVPYPAGAPRLEAGKRYAWELHTERQPVQRAEFEIVPPSDTTRLRSALASLEPGALSGYPPATVTVMRASFLLQEGLYQDARRELLDGIATNPNEPALHQLLGHVYDRIGIRDMAVDAFDEARFLTTPPRP
ncbi:MAG TPA: hypothetical protein VML54_06475 [Candidatus Limnocylindrales bacterium]|nr:hypothetical protein [Candidatus Limnocylindrales bacterium]